MINPRHGRISLPRAVTFLFSKVGEGIKAHCLDFDIVAVSPTESTALSKLREAVVLYVDHGLKNRWEEDILCYAPDKYWAQLTVDTPISLMDPITVEDQTMRVYSVESVHGARETVGAA